MAYGLYEVVPGKIWQVRGFDLSNISFIKGDTGWIVFDSLTTKETAKAEFDFINEKVGKRPVVAKPYDQLKGILVRFTPDVEIMPGTKSERPATPPATNPFEVDRPAVYALGD